MMIGGNDSLGPTEMGSRMVHGNGTVTTLPPSNNYNGSNNSKKEN